MTDIYLANTKSHYTIISKLATIVWTEHYTPIIGSKQVTYMLDKYQSENAIEKQINEGAYYFLIRYNGKDVGYFSYYKKETSLFLSKFYVLNSYRGKSIGKKAISFIEKKTNELNCNTISLTVNKYNSNSIKAYEKMGFKKIKDIVTDIGNGFVMDDFFMKKFI